MSLDIDWANVDWGHYLQTAKDVLGIAKDLRSLAPASAKREELAARLDASERQLHLAEAGIAKQLGYHLCKCTFPPSIMLKKGRDGAVDVYVCDKCGSREPPATAGPAAPARSELDEATESVLVFLSNNEDLDAQDIAPHVAMSPQLTLYHLEQMLQREFVRDDWEPGSPFSGEPPRRRWALRAHGREYLAKVGKL